MSEIITTAAELDALLLGVSEMAEAAVIMHNARPYLITEDEWGTFWAWTYQSEDEERPYIRADTLALPWTVLYRPDRPDAEPTVKPDREAVARAIYASYDILIPATFDEARVTEDEMLRATFETAMDSADAVLNLLPGRTEAEVLRQGWNEGFVASQYHEGTVAMQGIPWQVVSPPNPYAEAGESR